MHCNLGTLSTSLGIGRAFGEGRRSPGSFNTVAVYIELGGLGDFETEFVFGKAAGGEARCSPGGWFSVKATSALPLLESGGEHQHDKAALEPLRKAD